MRWSTLSGCQNSAWSSDTVLIPSVIDRCLVQTNCPILLSNQSACTSAVGARHRGAGRDRGGRWPGKWGLGPASCLLLGLHGYSGSCRLRLWYQIRLRNLHPKNQEWVAGGWQVLPPMLRHSRWSLYSILQLHSLLAANPIYLMLWLCSAVCANVMYECLYPLTGCCRLRTLMTGCDMAVHGRKRGPNTVCLLTSMAA